MLTLDQLKDMKPHEVFAYGTTSNDPDGVFMTNDNFGNPLLWVAIRGGIEDWAIYIHWADKGLQFVIDHGDKVSTAYNIKKLVPCTDEAFRMYRF